MNPIEPTGTHDPPQPAPPRTVAAFAVHLFTASGAACALLALMAAADGRWPTMFSWLGLALVIDGIDGTFARWARVGEVLPRWSGDVLDLVVDILTYVFVPAYAIAASGLLPRSVATALGIVVAVTGVLYFADRLMKTPDHYFRGFPALWNIAAFYLFLLRPKPWLCAALVVALAALSFAPIAFVHPVRVARWRTVTLAASALWSVLALFAVLRNLDPPIWVSAMLVAIGVYVVAIGLLRTAR